jgi:hypothetical protein
MTEARRDKFSYVDEYFHQPQLETKDHRALICLAAVSDIISFAPDVLVGVASS